MHSQTWDRHPQAQVVKTKIIITVEVMQKKTLHCRP